MAQLQLERNGALFGVHGLVRSKSTWQHRHCQRRRVSIVWVCRQLSSLENGDTS